MTTIRNPKNPNEAVETTLTEEQAIAALGRMQGNNFALSLYQQYKTKGALSASQYYWAFKLATEAATSPKSLSSLPLASDLESFLRYDGSNAGDDVLQFRIPNEGKVLLRIAADGVNVHANYQYQGKIVGNEIYPTLKASAKVIAEIILLSENPAAWMIAYGLRTGVCCVCGRQLTNEMSVARGIGPICAERFGF